MNNVPVRSKQQQMADECDPFTRVVGRLGMALFLFGIFVPGAHTLMMVGMALIAISYLV
jgi:hypothetical protein